MVQESQEKAKNRRQLLSGQSLAAGYEHEVGNKVTRGKLHNMKKQPLLVVVERPVC